MEESEARSNVDSRLGIVRQLRRVCHWVRQLPLLQAEILKKASFGVSEALIRWHLRRDRRPSAGSGSRKHGQRHFGAIALGNRGAPIPQAETLSGGKFSLFAAADAGGVVAGQLH